MKKKLDKRNRIQKAISTAGKAIAVAAKNRAGGAHRTTKRAKLDKIIKKEMGV